MSWSLNMVGKSADVKAAIAADPYLPQPLKDTVALFADAGKDNTPPATPPPGALQVKTSGHYDANSGYSNVNEFSITQVTLVVAPAPPPAPPAPPPTTPPEPAAT